LQPESSGSDILRVMIIVFCLVRPCIFVDEDPFTEVNCCYIIQDKLEVGGSSGTQEDRDFDPAVRTRNIITNFSVGKLSGKQNLCEVCGYHSNAAELSDLLVCDNMSWSISRRFERSYCIRFQNQAVQDFICKGNGCE
jgi:hypothetical protein